MTIGSVINLKFEMVKENPLKQGLPVFINNAGQVTTSATGTKFIGVATEDGVVYSADVQGGDYVPSIVFAGQVSVKAEGALAAGDNITYGTKGFKKAGTEEPADPVVGVVIKAAVDGGYAEVILK